MGGKQQSVILLVLFLVSLLSSVDVIRGSARMNFNKFTRQKTTTHATNTEAAVVYESKQKEEEEKQPLFYQQEEGFNPHGLDGASLTSTPTHPPPPPPPPHHHHKTPSPPTYTHYTPTPPPPSKSSNNYNTYQYVTKAGRNDLPSADRNQPKVIEDTNDDDLLNDEEEDEDEDELFDTTEIDGSQNSNDKNHGPASVHTYNSAFTTTTTPQGMSDTRTMRNGMYFYNTEKGVFPNANHPTNQLADQNNMYKNRFPNVNPTTIKDVDPLDDAEDQDEEFNTQQP